MGECVRETLHISTVQTKQVDYWLEMGECVKENLHISTVQTKQA